MIRKTGKKKKSEDVIQDRDKCFRGRYRERASITVDPPSTATRSCYLRCEKLPFAVTVADLVTQKNRNLRILGRERVNHRVYWRE